MPGTGRTIFAETVFTLKLEITSIYLGLGRVKENRHIIQSLSACTAAILR